jgi:hypothetical protein
LIWAAGLVYGLFAGFGAAGIVAFSMMTALLAAGSVAKVVLPHRTATSAGASRAGIALGAALGIVGFFVIPVVGMFVGFPLGVYLSERQRLGTHTDAWTSTKHALRATGLSILIEFIGTSLAAAIWLVAVLFLV